MLSAEDYIAMRAQARRTKWLNVAIGLIVLIIATVWLMAANREYLYESSYLIASVVVFVVLVVSLITSLIKAYNKSPYGYHRGDFVGSGYFLSSDSDGGDCGGD